MDWCRTLEQIKSGNGQAELNKARKDIADSLPDRTGIFCSCIDEYEQVCLFCWEALHNPEHNHGVIRRQEEYPFDERIFEEKNRPDEEDPLPDWEDSMLLLSI